MIEASDIVDVLDECVSMEREFLSLLKKLVRTETPPGDKKSHKKLFSILEPELAALDFDTQIFPGKESGGQFYARPVKMNKNGYQLLLGHADTVWPRGTLNKMPFEKNENIITGPGIYDMKAGLAMIVFALQLIDKQGLKPELAPVLFINSDEETGSTDSVSKIKKLAKAMDRVYVLEPSLDPDGKLKTRRKGVGHFKVKIEGTSSHAGIEPEKGRSAIVELSYIIQKLYALNDPVNGISINVGKIEGGISTNVVAPQSSASVDVRVLTKKDAEQIDREIKKIEPTIPDVKIKITGGFNRPPMVQNNRNRALWNAATHIGSELGIELSEGISGGGSDGSYTSLYTATLDGLGAVGDGAHSPTERIFLEQTLQRIAVLVNLLLLPPISE
ncbi:M20 family peptidase [Rhodohalobacter sp. SW132]|uniref:M20 family metallopeptidase n=1 Tax=Rhodohalobacter sp. SW132 TaxID=2293433 RepID=UPI000E287D56|nr:M20 family metallopeptidase [Rhodohalobacter sp. SW132]REL37721.1 M20 family peptidase [Rhodohalobacter sp. SW132]